MEVMTIGFAGRRAEGFFTALRDAGVTRVVDVRRWNTSQLAGYTKRADLPFLLAQLCDADYVHVLEAAPDAELLAAYRAGEVEWEAFTAAYREGLSQPVLAEVSALAAERPTALLCSEADARACHRSVLAQALRAPRGRGRLRAVHL